jgi:hypothetical protein
VSEITVTFTTEEAEALVPWKASDKSPDAWNRRLNAAEDAQQKIRTALREARREQPKTQVGFNL